jgi:hypothetical protein
MKQKNFLAATLRRLPASDQDQNSLYSTYVGSLKVMELPHQNSITRQVGVTFS